MVRPAGKLLSSQADATEAIWLAYIQPGRVEMSMLIELKHSVICAPPTPRLPRLMERGKSGQRGWREPTQKGKHHAWSVPNPSSPAFCSHRDHFLNGHMGSHKQDISTTAYSLSCFPAAGCDNGVNVRYINCGWRLLMAINLFLFSASCSLTSFQLLSHNS